MDQKIMERKVTEYIIVEHRNSKDLMNWVNRYLSLVV